MNKKRIIALSLVTVLTLINFVACGKSDAKNNESNKKTDGIAQEEKNDDINLDEFTVQSLSAKTLSSSSVLKDGNGISYDPVLVTDNDNSTAWVEGVKGNGIDEWVKLEFDGDIIIKDLFLINGYTKNSKIYYSNNRVKKVKVEFSDGTTLVSDLNDSISSPQAINLEKGIKTSFVKFTILDVFAGDKYQDTCISEIEVNGYKIRSEMDEVSIKSLKESSFEKRIAQEKKIERQSSNVSSNAKKTLCSCGKRYIEDNVEWKGYDKCDICIQADIESHADNYGCVVCGDKTDTLCIFDKCDALCEDHQGYYCKCGKFHHHQELCPVYD